MEPRSKSMPSGPSNMKKFNASVIAARGPITTMTPLNGKNVVGAELIPFDVSRFLERDYGRLSMGLKPSGDVHMGTVATILNGMLYLESHRSATLKIDIMDQDYDNQRGSKYWSFRTMPDHNGCHGLMKEHTLEQVKRLVVRLSRIMGIGDNRVEVSYYTDNYRCKEFVELIQTLIRERTRVRHIKKALTGKGRKPYKVPFPPICPDCGHSNTRNAVYDREKDVLVTTCLNDECESFGEEYSVPVATTTAYNVHYLVDPIRDIMDTPECSPADVHLFGGDYLWEHGYRKKAKVQRVADVMSVETNILPDFFVGALMTLNNFKMSKSLGAQAADDSVSDHIFTRLAEMLKTNTEPTVEVWNLVVGK